MTTTTTGKITGSNEGSIYGAQKEVNDFLAVFNAARTVKKDTSNPVATFTETDKPQNDATETDYVPPTLVN